MRFRRLMAASMAGVMAVSSAVVCQVTASAAETVIYEYNSADAGKLTSASLTDEAMTAVNSAAASVAVTVDGEGDGAYFYLQETTGWGCTKGSSPTVSIAKDDAQWTAFTSASGIKINLSGYTKVNKITVLIDGTYSYTVFDLSTAPHGMSFPTGGENYSISADTLADAGVTSDNISDARLVLTFESTGDGKQLALLASSGNWENQYYWSNSFISGELELPMTGSSDGKDLGDKALTTGIILHCKDSVISRIAISVTDPDAAPEEAKLPAYDGSPITMIKQAQQNWWPNGTAQGKVNMSLKGVTTGYTTFGDAKKKISNIVFDGLKYVKDSIGGSASDYTYCIFTQWGDDWKWVDSGQFDFESAASWSLSSITGIDDSAVFRLIGIQVNMKDVKNLPDKVNALKTDETFTINPDTVAAESVKITAADGSDVKSAYTYGDTLSLKAAVTPEGADGADAVVWKSSDTDVAEVADGAVTFRKAGTVTISAEAGGKSDSVAITVNKKKLTTSNAPEAIEVDAKNTLNDQLSAAEAAYVPAFSDGAALVKGTDYTVSAEASEDGKTYSVTVKLIGSAVDKYELGESAKTADVKYYLTSAAFEKHTLNLVAGAAGVRLGVETAPLSVTETYTVDMKSSDTSVATVAADGTVTPVKAGSAVITLTVTDAKGEYTDTCKVTVTDKQIPATGIKLDAETKTMTTGDRAKLTATVTPEDSTDSVSWKSSNEDVATVDENGNVTAKAVGIAKITAAAGEYTAECTVTVEAVKVSSVTLDKTSVELKAGETAQLTAAVKPDNVADKTVVWTSSDEKVATVADGKVTAVAEGTATITATAGGKTATCTVTVKAKDPEVVLDDKKHPDVPSGVTKVESVATTLNSDGTQNMLAVFFISDEDVKACDLLAVTIQREDGKVYSEKLFLENYYDSISYTDGDKTYTGSADKLNHYVAMKFLNVDPKWGAISIKVEPIIAKG